VAIPELKRFLSQSAKIWHLCLYCGYYCVAWVFVAPPQRQFEERLSCKIVACGMTRARPRQLGIPLVDKVKAAILHLWRLLCESLEGRMRATGCVDIA